MERLFTEPAALARRSDAEITGARGRLSWPIPLNDRHLIVALAVAMLALLAFFVRPVLMGRVPVHGDLGMLLWVFRDFYARCLCQGDAFDWMPQLFGGYYLTGGGACATYHPLNWLLYRCLPLGIAFNCEVYLPIVAMGAGTLVFLRQYINLAGAALGAIVASFSMVFITYLHTPQMTGALAHTPWLLAAIGWAVRSRTAAQRRLASAAIALLTGSEMLLAFPQAWWFSAIAAALFAVCLLVGQRAGWSAWLAVGIGAALGVGLGAVQLFPMYSFFEISTRAVADRATLPFPPVEPRSFWDIAAPYRTWNGFIQNYFGAAPLVLVLWWLSARRVRPDATPTSGGVAERSSAPDRASDASMVGQLSLWAVLLAIISGALAMGLKGKLYYLQLMLPVVGSFRSPWRILAITQFSVAILAGIAFAHLVNLVRSGRKVPWRHLLLPWLAVEVALLLTVWFDAQGQYDLFGHFFLCLGPLLIGGAAAGVTLAARGHPLGLFLLVLVTAIDFGTFSASNPGSGAYFTRHLPTYEQFVARSSGPPTANEGRVFYEDSRDGMINTVNCLGYHGYRAINGYSAMYPQRSLNYYETNALRVGEVAWVWQPVLSADCVPGRSAGGALEGGWRRVPHPLPRARLVSRVVVSAAPAKDLNKIDIDSAALVSHPLDLAPSRPGTARLQEDRPGRMGLEVEAPRRQLLTVSESYHDGWQVRIDGQPAALERVNGDFVGCVVEPGKHRVKFVFKPASLWWGQTVSLATLAVVLGMCFGPTMGWLRGWRSPSAPDKDAGVKARG
jgi:hypothetical protein